MELYSMLCGSLDGRGVWQRMDTCIYVCLKDTLHCSPETITTLLIGSIPIQNKKFKKYPDNKEKKKKEYVFQCQDPYLDT
jgi:hypothetical protein